MANIPPGESLASPTGTSGRSEVSEDDEDVAMETDSSGRYRLHGSLPFLVHPVAARMAVCQYTVHCLKQHLYSK